MQTAFLMSSCSLNGLKEDWLFVHWYDLKADQVSKGPPCEGKHITNITKIDEKPVRR